MENGILNQANLNWAVRSETVQTIESGIVIPKKIAIIREDTNEILGVHSNGYVPYQNEQLLELLYQVSNKTGLTLHSGGFFGSGEKVFIQLKSNDHKLPNDEIRGYISGFNSFDGSTSLGFGNSSVTVSCMNTFYKGYKQIQTKVKHTSSMQTKIDDILYRVDELLGEEKKFFNQIDMLGNVKLSPEVKEMVIRTLFDIDKQERLDSEAISTNKKTKSNNSLLI